VYTTLEEMVPAETLADFTPFISDLDGGRSATLLKTQKARQHMVLFDTMEVEFAEPDRVRDLQRMLDLAEADARDAGRRLASGVMHGGRALSDHIMVIGARWKDAPTRVDGRLNFGFAYQLWRTSWLRSTAERIGKPWDRVPALLFRRSKTPGHSLHNELMPLLLGPHVPVCHPTQAEAALCCWECGAVDGNLASLCQGCGLARFCNRDCHRASYRREGAAGHRALCQLLRGGTARTPDVQRFMAMHTYFAARHTVALPRNDDIAFVCDMEGQWRRAKAEDEALHDRPHVIQAPEWLVADLPQPVFMVPNADRMVQTEEDVYDLFVQMGRLTQAPDAEPVDDAHIRRLANLAFRRMQARALGADAEVARLDAEIDATRGPRGPPVPMSERPVLLLQSSRR
jgi:hypothetical protein